MQKSEKERVVAELTERLRTSETLIVADYRGLTNAEIDGLRSKLIEHGARFSVVKNTLTRRAAEAAGADALLALLEGPSAIAFVESDGDPAAVAKALRDAATSTKILAIEQYILRRAPDSSYFYAYREQNRTLDQLDAFYSRAYNLTGSGGPERIPTLIVSPASSTLSGVPPSTGRAFVRQEEQWGSHRVAILSHGLWQRRFGGDNVSSVNRSP